MHGADWPARLARTKTFSAIQFLAIALKLHAHNLGVDPVVGNVLPDKFQVVRIPRGKY